MTSIKGPDRARGTILKICYIFTHEGTLTARTDYADRSRSYIKPIMVLSKFPMDASFQITPIEGYLNLTEADLEYEGVWEEKTDNRLFWRGSTTGGFNTQYRDWRDNHRVRMHVMVNGKKGVAGGGGAGGGEEWKEVEREIMLPDGKGGYVVKRRKEGMLSGAYAEVKLSGQAIQVSFGRASWEERGDGVEGARTGADEMRVEWMRR